MTKKFLLLGTITYLGLMAFSGPVLAEGRPSLKVPDGWVEVFRDQKPGVQLVEYLPKEQTLKTWSEMITYIQSEMHGIKIIKALINSSAGSITTRCRNKALTRGRYWEKDGKKVGMIIDVACDSIDTSNAPPGVTAYKKELLRIFAADSKRGVFTLQLAWHDQEKSAKALFDDPNHIHLFETLIAAKMERR